MRNSRTTTQLVTSLSIGIINTSIAVYQFFTMGNFAIFFITMWAYYANSIYLFVVMICDIAYYFSYNKLEALNYSFRRYFSVISMTYSYYVTLSFWVLVCFGNNVMTMKPSLAFKILSVYLHGINTLFVIVDLKVAEHYKVHFSYNHILGLLTVFLCYASLLLVARYIIHFNPYPFMTLVNLPVLIVIGVIMFGFIVLCYLFHLFLLRHNKEEEIIEGEYQELKDDNNIN